MAAGEGKTGYCKLCAWSHAPELDRGVRQGWNAAQAQEWAKRYGFTFNRQTYYAHKPHALSPEQRVIQAAEKKMRQTAVIRKGSNQTFLEAVRDIGFTKAIEDPDSITIDHALKAASLLEQREKKGGDVINLLVSVSTGSYNPAAVEVIGEAVEVNAD